MADRRASISLAALLVKVTARMEPGVAWPVCSSQAMRVVSTRVLPEPAPARISAWPAGSVTAASCSSRSEEHTSELQSPCNLVCRLLLEKKKKQENRINILDTTAIPKPRTTHNIVASTIYLLICS